MDFEKIADEELARGDPRSLEYRQGMIDVLKYRLEGTAIPKRYRVGTAEADAFYSGIERGHLLARKIQFPEANA